MSRYLTIPHAALVSIMAVVIMFLIVTLPAPVNAAQRCMMVYVPDAPAKPETRVHGHYEHVTDLDHDERAVA